MVFLDGISLLVSSTIDPRLPDLFDQVVFFHRPVAAATSLFPDDGASVLPVVVLMSLMRLRGSACLRLSRATFSWC